MFEKLIDLSVEKWRSTFFIMFLLFLFGVTGYINIPKESSPEVVVPVVLIDVFYKGVSPEDGERMLIKPIETQVKSISGIKKLECTAKFGAVSCTIEFVAGGLSIQKALSDVRDAVNIAKSEFPREAEEPFVREEYDTKKNEPVLTINISGDLPDDLMFKIADDLKDKITGLKEVLSVDVYGKRDHSVDVLIKPEAITQYKLNINDFKNIPRQNNLIVGGRLRTGDGEFTFHIPGLISNLRDLLSMPIKTVNNEVIKLDQIAKVKKTYKEPTSFARLDGTRTLTMNISKRSGENILETVSKTRAIIDEYAAYLPKTVRIDFMNDASKSIKEDLTNLNNNLILAIIIVFFVVLNLIGLRESLIIMTTIPLTFLMGIMFLYLGGNTLNIVVLFALILGTGMIVDASIVIIEYAEMLIKNGVPHPEAFRRSAKRMFIPVFSSVVTVLIVATPLLFWPGFAGQFMKYLPLTLIALLSSSFIVAIFFLPCIGAKFGKSHTFSSNELNLTNIIRTPVKTLTQIEGALGWYINTVWLFIRNPKKTLLGLLGLLITILILYLKFNKGVEFFPNIENNFSSLRVETTGNLSLAEKDKLVLEVEKVVSQIKDVKHYQGLTFTSGSRGIGRINLEFKDWREGRKPNLILQEIRDKTAKIPGILVKVNTQKMGPSGAKAVSINIIGKETSDLEESLSKIRSFMEADGNFVDIEDNSVSKKIQYSLKIDREKAGRYGIDIETVGAFVSLVTDGLIISNYRPSYSDDKVDIILRYPPEYRGLKDIENLKVPSSNGGFVPISNFAKLVMERETTNIIRLNQKRSINLNANIKEGVVPSFKIAELFKWIMDNKSEFTAEIQLAGDEQEKGDSISFLSAAFGSAIVIMLLLFLIQFNSVGKTIIVTSSIFLSIFGVLIALMLTGQAFSIVMSGIAVIALAGIVVDSSILFIETFKDLESEGLSIDDALLKTAIVRLKPILLASMTTVAGMIPMIFGISVNFIERDITIGAPSGKMWTQLSAGIAGGLTFVTLLTLFITPTIILLEENFKKRIKNRFKRSYV
jgi:multidrug efflux pump